MMKVLGSNPCTEMVRIIIGVRSSVQKMVDEVGSSTKLKMVLSQR